MLLNIVNNYETLRQSMGVLIDKSGYRNAFIAEKIGMQPAYFSTRKKSANWTVDEIKKILALIENKDLQEFYDIELIKKSMTGKDVSTEDFEKQMKWS